MDGSIAAAGIYALNNHIGRLKEDHYKAKEIGSELQKLGFVKKVEPIETNIVIFNLKDGKDEKLFIDKMAREGVQLISMGDGKLRIVTHMDYTDPMHERFLSILKRIKV